MHALTWRTNNARHTWTFPDGLFDLTPHIGGHRAAVVASGDCAVLLLDDRRALLTPGRPTPLEDGEIEWQPPETLSRPTALGNEPTRGDRDHAVAGALVLISAEGDELPLADLQACEPRITEQVFSVLTVENAVQSRNSHGGTAPDEVRRVAKSWLKRLETGGQAG